MNNKSIFVRVGEQGQEWMIGSTAVIGWSGKNIIDRGPFVLECEYCRQTHDKFHFGECDYFGAPMSSLKIKTTG